MYDASGEPDRVMDFAPSMRKKVTVGNLELSSPRRSVALGDRFDAPLSVEVVNDNQTDRHPRW